MLCAGNHATRTMCSAGSVQCPQRHNLVGIILVTCCIILLTPFVPAQLGASTCALCRSNTASYSAARRRRCSIHYLSSVTLQCGFADTRRKHSCTHARQAQHEARNAVTDATYSRPPPLPLPHTHRPAHAHTHTHATPQTSTEILRLLP